MKSKSVICQIPPPSWVDSWWVALQDVFRSKHLQIVTKPLLVWKPKLLHLHFSYDVLEVLDCEWWYWYSTTYFCVSVTAKWIQIRLRQVFVNLSLLSRLCSSAATSLQLGSGANLKLLRQFRIQTSLAANHCHKTKTKHQFNMLYGDILLGANVYVIHK